MSEISALFWDVGGVFLTNAWDRMSRQKAAEEFELDWDEFDSHHQSVVRDFEIGRIGLDEYLRRAVFYRERTFGGEDFKDFMFQQSELKPETLDIIARLARSGKYLLCTINNESLELNRHRIERFGLREYFSLFFTSSFLGVMKPDEAIYRIALSVTQRRPEESLFIDDRAKNAEVARQCGMRAIHFQSPSQLRSDLEALGVES